MTESGPKVGPRPTCCWCPEASDIAPSMRLWCPAEGTNTGVSKWPALLQLWPVCAAPRGSLESSPLPTSLAAPQQEHVRLHSHPQAVSQIYGLVTRSPCARGLVVLNQICVVVVGQDRLVQLLRDHCVHHSPQAPSSHLRPPHGEVFPIVPLHQGGVGPVLLKGPDLLSPPLFSLREQLPHHLAIAHSTEGSVSLPGIWESVGPQRRHVSGTVRSPGEESTMAPSKVACD